MTPPLLPASFPPTLPLRTVLALVLFAAACAPPPPPPPFPGWILTADGASTRILGHDGWWEDGALVLAGPWPGAELRLGLPGPSLPPRIDGRALVVRRGDIEERWQIEEDGIWHSFVVKEPGDVLLRLPLDLPGATVALDADQRGAILTVGTFSWSYRGLRAWDATGRMLSARMEARPQGLDLLVATGGAVAPVTVDPLLSPLGWSVAGDGPAAFLGGSVNSAGDVNGDGYDDLLVGAPGASNGHASEGRASLFLGGPAGLGATPVWSVEGQQTGAVLGGPVAGAGDVNDDGFSDVIVASPGYDNGATNEGKVWLYLGGSAGLPTTAAWSAEGNGAERHLGDAVAGVGDVNGDGYGDVVIGAPAWSANLSEQGRVELHLGGPGGPDNSADRVLSGTVVGSQLGSALARAGDVNGDGFADVLVGEPGWSDAAATPEEGRALLYLGSATGLPPLANWAWPGNSPGARAGEALAGAGDINGDGFTELLVGAPGWGGIVSPVEGRAWLFAGGAAGPGTSASWLSTGSGGTGLGSALGAAGDVNGDGFGDFVLGEPDASGTLSSEGALRLHMGRADLSTLGSPAQSVFGGASSGRLGFVVGPAGDVDGDGFAEPYAGAPTWSGTQTWQGRVTVGLGAGSGLGTSPASSALGPLAGGQAGAAATWVGDMDGDGRDEVAWRRDGNTVAITAGGTSLQTAPLVLLNIPGGLGVGARLAAAGDVDGDGTMDLLVGTPAWNDGQPGEGRVLLFTGNRGPLPNTPSATWEGEQAGAALGTGLAGLGDVDGDGYGDIALGAPGWDEGSALDAGRVQLLRGGPDGPELCWSAAGSAGSEEGASIASFYDGDGDGFADLVSGAPSFTNGQSEEGRVSLWWGGTADLGPTRDAALEGGVTGAHFGAKVAGGGDADGDGRGDLLVGAPDWGGAYSQEGRLGFHPGSAAGLNNATRLWTGGAAYLHLGQEAAFAGDVDGDGFVDMVVGAPFATSAHTGEGRVQLFAGGPSGPSTTAAWTRQGGQTGASLGLGLAAGGDGNGDGFADLLLGAPGIDDASGSDRGEVQLFPGNQADIAGSFPVPARPWVAEEADPLLHIMPGARARTGRFVRAATQGRGSQGRIDGRIEVEAQPLSQPLDGSLIQFGTAWTDLGTAGSSLSFQPGSLPWDGPVHLRVRARFRPSHAPIQSRSRWISLGRTGDLTGLHLRTACAPGTDGDGDGLCDANDPDDDGDQDPDLTDCDDQDPNVSHLAEEEPADGHDADCDGVDLCWTDADLDGAGTLPLVPDLDLDCGNGGGRAATDDDCDDADAMALPGGIELVADGRDGNCDGLELCWQDGDGDAWGGGTTGTRPGLSCVGAGWATVTGDCDDGDPTRHPGAPETVADGIDQDCSGGDRCFLDLDQDGWGDTAWVDDDDLSCSPAEQQAAVSGDCADTLAAVHPMAPELCDGLENDCALGSPTPAPGSPELDPDQDGVLACAPYVEQGGGFAGGGDCAPLDPQSWPGAPETCDGIDQDCDGDVLEGFPNHDGDGEADCVDPDDDGDGAPDIADCAPLDAGRHPAAVELAADGVDQDCTGGDRCYEDLDGDGRGSLVEVEDDDLSCTGEAGMAAVADDCRDDLAWVHPGAPERCDGWSDGCQGVPLPWSPPPWEQDQDGDGLVPCAPWEEAGAGPIGGGDCDDQDAAVHPGAPETPADGVDTDCDGAEVCWADLDEDGLGAVPVLDGDLDCEDDPAQSGLGGDCDDGEPFVRPGLPEACDGFDTDCSEGGGPAEEATEQDGDGDAFVPCAPWAPLAESPTLSGGDCDDGDPARFPGAPELCDGIDSDCDGDTGDGYADLDGDGLPDCMDDDDDGDGVPGGPDCDDRDPTVLPGAPESCDGLDSDCDGGRVDGFPDGDQDLIPDCVDPDDDGDGAADDVDCAPLDPRIAPGADELCDGQDDDCDGEVDEDWDDQDGDGIADCVDEDDDDDGALDGEDCAPMDPRIHPGAAELCDGVDSDCDGDLQDDLPDTDGDGVPDCDETGEVEGDLGEGLELELTQPGTGCGLVAGRTPGWAWSVALLVLRRRRRGRNGPAPARG